MCPRHGIGVFAIVLLFGLVACSPPTGASDGGSDDDAAASRSFSGVVFDAVTGVPIEGAVVRSGPDIDATDTDGGFEFSLSGPLEVRSHPFSVTADGYEFLYVESLDVDTSVSVRVSIPLTRTSGGSYDDRVTIVGRVFESGGTELELGTVDVEVVSGDGGRFDAGAFAYDPAVGVRIQSPIRTADSLIVFFVESATYRRSTGELASVADFAAYVRGVDLSGAGPVSVSVSQPAADHYRIVTLVQGEPQGEASCELVPDRRRADCFFVPVSVDGITMPELGASRIVSFEGSSTRRVGLYNPFNWDAAVFTHSCPVSDLSLPPGHARRWCAVSSIVTPADRIALPDIDRSLGPTAAPDLGSLTYGSYVLSLDPIAGADLVVHRLEDSFGGLGTVWSRGPSATIPEYLSALIAGSVLSDRLEIYDLAPGQISPHFLGSGARTSGVRLGEVYGDPDPYSALVNMLGSGTVEVDLE